jgi:hypothetical protein
MYYFVNFTYKDEIMEADPDVTLLPCEWVVKADSKEEAIEQIKKDIEVDEILEIREISAEERIEREQSDLLEMIKWDYLYRRCANMSIREYSKVQKEFESNLEIKYLALQEFNKKQRLIKRLSRQEGFKDMTMAEFNEKINQLIDAKDEEEFNKILRSVQKK